MNYDEIVKALKEENEIKNEPTGKGMKMKV